jgi:hypothetical protein
MTNFGSYLGQIIASDYDGHRANFAKAAGLTGTSMTNYLARGELPSPATVGRIVKAVHDPFKKAELASAYLSDVQSAAKISGEVSVTILPIHAKPSVLDLEIRAMMEAIEQRARRDAAYRRIVKDISEWP